MPNVFFRYNIHEQIFMQNRLKVYVRKLLLNFSIFFKMKSQYL